MMAIRSTQQVVALAISDGTLVAMIEPAGFVEIPFGTPRKVLAISQGPWDGTGRMKNHIVMTELHAAESRRGRQIGNSFRERRFQDAVRLAIASGGRFISVVRNGQVAELVDAMSGVVVSSFRIPAGAFGLEATEEGAIGVRVLESVVDRKRRRWVGIESEPIIATTTTFTAGVRSPVTGTLHVDPFDRGRVVSDAGVLAWVDGDRAVDLDPTPELLKALANPASSRMWNLNHDGTRLVVAITNGGLIALSNGECLPFVEAWDLSTGERLMHEDLVDGDDVFFPTVMVPAGNGVEISALVLDAKDPSRSMTTMNNAFNLGESSSIDFRSLRIDGTPGRIDSRPRSGLVAGVALLDDGHSVTLEIPIAASPASLLIESEDGHSRKILLPFGFQAAEMIVEGGIASRLVTFDGGRSIGVLSDELLVLDADEWILLGSIESTLLGGGILARWNGIRMSDEDGTIELSGVDERGRVVVNVPGRGSRRRVASPAS